MDAQGRPAGAPQRNEPLQVVLRIGVPEPGLYVELLNSDASIFGGGNVGNGGGVASEPVPAHGFDQSLRLVVPPLGCLYLRKRE